MNHKISILCSLLLIGCVSSSDEEESGIYGKWGSVTYVDGGLTPHTLKLEFAQQVVQYYVDAFGIDTLIGEIEIKVWNDSVLQLINRDSLDEKVFQEEFQLYKIGPFDERTNRNGYKEELRLTGSTLAQDCQSKEICNGEFPLVLRSGSGFAVYR